MPIFRFLPRGRMHMKYRKVKSCLQLCHSKCYFHSVTTVILRAHSGRGLRVPTNYSVWICFSRPSYVLFWIAVIVCDIGCLSSWQHLWTAISLMAPSYLTACNACSSKPSLRMLRMTPIVTLIPEFHHRLLVCSVPFCTKVMAFGLHPGVLLLRIALRVASIVHCQTNMVLDGQVSFEFWLVKSK
jgi:hypothetical protein